MKTTLYASLIALAVAGCSSTPTSDQPGGAQVEDRTGGPSAETPDVGRVRPGGGLDARDFPQLRDPKNILSKRSVYFDFDSFVVKDDYKSLMDAHARFLSANGKMKMLIQGNADERGSREYNLALGQKRAEAVKRNLLLLGAKEDQVESVSLGEEKPKNTGHDDTAWAENRRADMLYNGEY